MISLIHKYLNAGVMANPGNSSEHKSECHKVNEVSPLLSNIMLNELDKELERRGHRFVRYADDCMIFCKSRKVQKEPWRTSFHLLKESYF